MSLNLGRIGVRFPYAHGLQSSELEDVLADIEDAGWGALWFAGTVATEQMPIARELLDHSQRITVATGIIGIFGSDAVETAELNRRLLADHPGRFLLGLGVSHPEGRAEGVWGKPLGAMRSFLDELDGVDPKADPSQRVLAALGPKMLQLAAERAGGAHPYFTPVEHTASAREQFGVGPLLAPEQMVVLERDASRARQIARKTTSFYLNLSNYASNLRKFGFDDDDFTDGGSDRLVDAIVAWGDVDAVAARIAAHHAAGADHVCVQVLTEGSGSLPRQEWRQLAALL